MKKLILIVCLVALTGCSKEPAVEKSNDSGQYVSGVTTQQDAAAYAEQEAKNSVKNTMGYKLISIADQGNDVSVDDPRVSALNGKLESLSNQTGMSEENIADISYYFEKEIKKENKKSDIDEILEVISMGVDNKACELQTEKTKECISRLLATYTIARIKANQDHLTATHSLKSILDVVNDPEKRAKLEAMINTQ
ncbi:hypothetical protein RMB03_06925 [Acinetobacter sp. V91_7]|uniref:hypothetical protein n=1 Tax=unclassified Acinetobacter TaxID=196816 RepID=UPI00287F36A9|nr:MULTISPECIES: hypothetical protein [unclassified Acinetobacter]MDS7933979.1 hypothetical protein [Acinetobacter sp. V91_4B]MDS7962685.1 hypothetical protein [Acinetobacter sp. V91_7]MDS8029412.1 hypothetical protein [Acinetobacter sp. V91_13]